MQSKHMNVVCRCLKMRWEYNSTLLMWKFFQGNFLRSLYLKFMFSVANSTFLSLTARQRTQEHCNFVKINSDIIHW